jgi:hypothetical protein
LTQTIDTVLKILKWPFAVFAVLLLPGALWVLAQMAVQLAAHPWQFGPFLGGTVGYFVAWRTFFRKRAWGSMMSTLEHELTHALFGILTFRMIRNLNITWSEGGHVTFPGRVNWLILIAPYWFPTISVFFVLIMGFLDPSLMTQAEVFLGVTVSYHLTSTWVETHTGQSDLARAGFPFCWCILPFLNVWAYGSLLAFVVGGPGEAMEFSTHVFGRSTEIIQAMIG